MATATMIKNVLVLNVDIALDPNYHTYAVTFPHPTTEVRVFEHEDDQ